MRNPRQTVRDAAEIDILDCVDTLAIQGGNTMASKLEEIESAALRLERSARARLVEKLLLSLEVHTEAEIEQRWAEEAARRAREMDAGTAVGIPSEQVFESARALLK